VQAPAPGHTLGEVTVITPPAPGIAGVGTAKCTVCGEILEISIPAPSEAYWNFDGTDPEIYLRNSGKELVTEIKNEDGKSFISYSYSGDGYSGEWVVGFYTPDGMGMLTDDEYVVFEADINIAELIPTDSYAASASPWIVSVGITDAVTAQDYDSVNQLWYVIKGEDGTSILIGDKSNGVEVPYREWFNLKMTFIRNSEDNTKIDVVCYVNGLKVYQRLYDDSAKRPGFGTDTGTVTCLDSEVLGVKFKFKSKANLESASYCFDSVKLYKTEAKEN
jgi:hypothetical protein